MSWPAASGPPSPSDAPVTIVGLGADGWAGLAVAARHALVRASVVLGGPRQLDLLPAEVTARRVSWPRPLRPSVGLLVAEHAPAGLVVLASGDPMHFGIGRALAEEVGTARLLVLPQPSSISLACARLGWAVEDVDVVSAVGRDVAAVAACLHEGRRVIVLSSGADTPAQLARVAVDAGFGGTRMTVLADLGADDETRLEAVARSWPDPPVSALNVVALDCVGDGRSPRLGLTPGLPDDAYDHDGQLTKRDVRAVTLAALAPAPGELLWDIGGGSGSIGIEWMRAHRTCRALTVEPQPDRVGRITANASRLGVPGLRVVTGRAPEALCGLHGGWARPDAIFVGGGLTAPGLVDACWAALRPGGRIVANTVTLESEAVLVAARAEHGGDLVRLEVSRADAVGSFSSWAPARPVTQWRADTPSTTAPTAPTAPTTPPTPTTPTTPTAPTAPTAPTTPTTPPSSRPTPTASAGDS